MSLFQDFLAIFVIMSDDDDKDFVLLPHYSGNPVGHHGEGLSCDQFCAIVESQIGKGNKNVFSEHQIALR